MSGYISFLLAFLLTFSTARAQDIRTQLRLVSNDMVKQLTARNKNSVAISSFLDLDNQETQLGRYMADKFSIGMVASVLQITDRSQLAHLLNDNKLSSKIILDPKTVPQLGKITGAQVVITGNYTTLDNTIDITVKAIDIERGLIIAVSEGAVPRTSEVNKLLENIKPAETIPPVPEIKEMKKDDCHQLGGSYYGKICFENKTKEPLVLYWIYGANLSSAPLMLVAPGTKNCTEMIPLGSDSGAKPYRFYFQTTEEDPDKLRYGKLSIDVESCKIKPQIINASNFFLSKTKPE